MGFSDAETESDHGDECEQITNQLAFTLLLKKFPILMEKSQLPAVKASKAKAAEELLHLLKIQNGTGTPMNNQALFKKIGNMKAFIKKKIDKNRTRNKKIVLLEWEKQFSELMKPDTNPALSKVKGALTCGIKRKEPPNETTLAIDTLVTTAAVSYTPTPTMSSEEPKRQKNLEWNVSGKTNPITDKAKKAKTADLILKKAENDDTKLLSTQQLQRLVLLEQLKLIKLKQERMITNLQSETASSETSRSISNTLSAMYAATSESLD